MYDIGDDRGHLVNCTIVDNHVTEGNAINDDNIGAPSNAGIIACNNIVEADSSILHGINFELMNIVDDPYGRQLFVSESDEGELTDYRLKWDASALEAGHSTNPGLDYDQDLTKPDIGWMPQYEVINLVGSPTSIAAGCYLVPAGTSITLNQVDIDCGATIKVDAGAMLTIKPAGSGFTHVGSVDSMRTAIVGRGELLGNQADAIKIMSNPNQILSFDGFLFNYPPEYGGMNMIKVVET